MVSPDSDDNIFEAAATWWQRLRGEEAYDIDAFEAWCAQDERHVEALDAVRAAWGAYDAHATEPEILTARSETLDRAQQTVARRWKGKGVDRRNLVAGAALAAATVVAVPITVNWLSKQPVRMATGVGEQRTLSLPDGSRVTVDANSQLEIAFDSNVRKIDMLAGRAHFEVAKDASRPFKVHTANRTVIALGTAFSVERRQRKISVTLVEGQIAVERETAGQEKRQPLEMTKPFEQFSVREDDNKTPLPVQIDPQHALAWREGKLFFDDEALAEAAARMNDYSSTRILVTGPAANLRISGMFLAGQTEAFIEALENYYPLKAQYSGQSVTIEKRT